MAKTNIMASVPLGGDAMMQLPIETDAMLAALEALPPDTDFIALAPGLGQDTTKPAPIFVHRTMKRGVERYVVAFDGEQEYTLGDRVELALFLGASGVTHDSAWLRVDAYRSSEAKERALTMLAERYVEMVAGRLFALRGMAL